MKNILIVGLPFFPHKYKYLVNSYQDLGIEVKVLLNTSENGFKGNDDLGDVFYFSGSGRLSRFYSFFRALRNFSPKNVDCYDYSVFTLFYVLISRLMGINVRLWLIGWELVGDRQNINTNSTVSNLIVDLKMYLTRFSLRFVNVIYAKEFHHLETIKEINPNLLSKVINIYNCVPVENEFKKRLITKDFLYANAVIEKRNVIDLLKAFFKLKNQGVRFTASIYGFNSISNEVYAARGSSYSAKALNVYESLELDKYVEVHGFVNNIKEVMQSYKFFVLPADIILANYSLLEAMSFGLVPIIYPGNGYEEIVEDGVNGIVVKNFDLANSLKYALSLTDTEYSKMSAAAHKKIKNDFSLELWKKKLSQNLN